MPDFPEIIEVGQSYDFVYDTIDGGGQAGSVDDPEAIISVDEDILTVDVNGKVVTVTGVGPGDGTIRLSGEGDGDPFTTDIPQKVVAADQSIAFHAHFPKQTIDVDETMTGEIIPTTWQNQAGSLDAPMSVVSSDPTKLTVVGVVGSQVTVHGEAGGSAMLQCTGTSHGVALPNTNFGLSVRALAPAVAFVITSVSPIREA